MYLTLKMASHGCQTCGDKSITFFNVHCFLCSVLRCCFLQVEREEQIDGSGKSVQGGERKGNMGVIDGVRTEANWYVSYPDYLLVLAS
jgi:hypothetical protein